MSRALVLVLCLLAIVLALYGWGNTYVTVAADDPHAYRPFVLRAFLFLGLSQLIFAAVAVRTKGLTRHLAVAAVLANCFPLFHNTIHAAFVLF